MPTYEVKADFRGALEAVGARRLGDLREQRRYEIARDVMAAMIGADQYTQRHVLPSYAEIGVAAADALLAALEETER